MSESRETNFDLHTGGHEVGSSQAKGTRENELGIRVD